MSSTTLVSHRETHGKAVMRIAKWSKAVDIQNTNRGLVMAQLQLLDSTWEKLTVCQLGIEQVCGTDELSIQQNHIAIMEPVFLETKGTILTILENFNSQSPPPPDSVPASTSDVKLPRQELPKFDGNPLSWNSFRDLFTKLIHCRQHLSGAQKLHFLKDCLHGNAALLLRSYEVTDSNYQEAWVMLCERFENERLIVNEYIKTMFNFHSLKNESASNLRKLIDTFKDALRALKALQQPVDHWDTLLNYLMVLKLDSESHRQWELSLKDNKIQSFKGLLEFLECRCRSLEAVGVLVSKQQQHKSDNTKQQNVLTLTCASNSCIKCNASHSLSLCAEFLQMGVKERFEFAKLKGLCLNCLKFGHQVGLCRATTCRTCHRKHHTVLHFPRRSSTTTNNSNVITNQPGASIEANPSTVHPQPNYLNAPTANVGVSSSQPRHILLSTAMVNIKLDNGNLHQIRILIDPGSTATFITENCVQLLGLRRKSTKIPIFGIGESSPGYSQGMTSVTIQSNYDRLLEISVTALILSKVTKQLPKIIVSDNIHQSLCGLNLADAKYFNEGNIDMLIGADYYGEILLDGVIKGNNGTPTAQRTIFGWILSGPVDTASISSYYTTPVSLHVHTDLEYQLRKFWEIETIDSQQLNSPEEKICEELFVNNHRRGSDGRFIVQLPFKNSSIELGNSICIAERSFLSLEKRFINDPELLKNYSMFINEYIRLNQMEVITDVCSDNNSYYLPHHPVFKENSSTTKLRVVFDASRKTSNNVSLNDLLLVGPKIQDDLIVILTRFRMHRFVFVCDISKMYRQFWVSEEHQDFQRILWRSNPEHPIKKFKLKTITYGTAPASFLATRCLKQISIDHQQTFQQAAEIIASDFYVDDLMTGSDTIHDSLRLQGEIISILKKYGLELRKWASNSIDIVNAVPEEHRECLDQQEIDPISSIRALGLLWFPLTDQFGFDVQLDLNQNQFTKRQVLSEIARIFDPLGLVSPTVVISKLLMQRLWAEGIGWDQILPDDLLKDWLQFRAELIKLENIKIPRWIGCSMSCDLELHGFCDASELAYSSVIYCRTRSDDGSICIRIISSKTRVAPVKQTTLARLELCAAVLLAKQYRYVVTALKLSTVKYWLWTDSMIVLAWLKKLQRTWSTFVGNRVAEVQELTCIDRWKHVPSCENPADIASRGALPSKLINSSLWWFGPPWLLKDENLWPVSVDAKTTNIEQRKKPITVLTATMNDGDILLERFSSLRKLKLVTSFLFRFSRNCNAKRNNLQRQIGPTTAEERENALLYWIKYVQNLEFHEEIKRISGNLNLHARSKILSLSPFLDEFGVLRVGGRLRHSSLPYDSKHQIILPSKGLITNLIIKDIHEKNLHSGALLTLATFRQRYWICSGRRVINSFIHRCVRCFRFKKNNRCQPRMGDLPASRINISHPFQITGVDFAGPVTTRFSSKRSKITTKGYICVFVCFSTKAVHLEMVSDLSTSSFLASFRRFVGRRGIPKELHSDCGTNFVGASKELKMLYRHIKLQFGDHILINALGDIGTIWKFIPPSSPNFGGLWESAVKSMKNHLIRVIGTTILSFEEFTTVLCQIEACLNSRPLGALTEDVNDYSVLTPGHFLIGRPINNVPDPNVTHININRLSRWQLVQKITQEFWKRWHNEYLNTLQQRPKWKMATKSIKLGDLVLIQDERLSPAKWLLGRVIRLHPGRDNTVRVVSVKTVGGELKRPCNKLCILPVETNSLDV